MRLWKGVGRFSFCAGEGTRADEGDVDDAGTALGGVAGVAATGRGFGGGIGARAAWEIRGDRGIAAREGMGEESALGLITDVARDIEVRVVVWGLATAATGCASWFMSCMTETGSSLTLAGALKDSTCWLESEK